MSDQANLPATRAAMPLSDMQRLAESIAKSRLFGITTPDQALTLMSIAQAEGRHPALAARDYHIIQGSPAKKAEAMARDFLSAGGRIEWHQLDDTAADATFSHPSGGSVRITWDQKRVTQAGLGTNAMHKKYPRQMLRSRVVSEGVRTVWPMATSGMYVPEEVAAFGAAGEREPIDITPKADLDAFAAADDDRLRLEAESAATDGVESFRAFWRGLPAEGRAALKPDIAIYQQVAQGADARKTAERDGHDDEDPFGLPPLDQARTGQPHSPAGDGGTNHSPPANPEGESGRRQGSGDTTNAETQPAGDTNTKAGLVEQADTEGLNPSAIVRDGSSPSSGTTDAPVAQLGEQPAFNRMAAGSTPAGRTDLLGDKPTESLTVPLDRNPTIANLDPFHA